MYTAALTLGSALALSAASCGAQAQSLTASQILTQFNAVVSGNFASGSDVEGRLLANKISHGATFYNNPSAQAGASSFAAVNAVTITGCASCNVNNGGNVNYTVKNSGHFNLNGGGSIVQNSPAFTLSSFTTTLDGLESSLSKLSANSKINASDPNNYTFNVSANASGVAVFNVSASSLESARNLNFSNASSASTIIVNVTSTSTYAFVQSFNFNAVTSGAYNLANHIIWNFQNATSLQLNQWQGAVLAGNANVNINSPLNGFLYAKNFTGNGELHNLPFTGNLGAVVAAPGPQAGVGLIPTLALGGLAFWGLRRRREARAA